MMHSGSKGDPDSRHLSCCLHDAKDGAQGVDNQFLSDCMNRERY